MIVLFFVIWTFICSKAFEKVLFIRASSSILLLSTGLFKIVKMADENNFIENMRENHIVPLAI